MVVIKLAVLVMFSIIAFTAFDADHFADFAPFGVAGVATAAGTIFFSFIGLDAVSTAGDEVKDPQKTMPRALIGALFIVIAIYLLVADLGHRRPALAGLRGPVRGRPVADPGDHHRQQRLGAPSSPLGAVISIFSVTLVTHVRPDPHPVRDGPRRDAAEGVRQASARAPRRR